VDSGLHGRDATAAATSFAVEAKVIKVQHETSQVPMRSLAERASAPRISGAAHAAFRANENPRPLQCLIFRGSIPGAAYEALPRPMPSCVRTV
jgi:hypothetical protein